MPRESIIYAPIDRPDVEVLVDGTWHKGELRAWIPDEETGGWKANVQYRLEAGATYLNTVPEDQVRPDPRGHPAGR